MFNTKLIEICSGLKPGDRVLLAPPFDTQEKDLGGAIIANGETLPAGMTNQPGRSLAKAARGDDRNRSGPSRPGGKGPAEPNALAEANKSGFKTASVAGERGGGEAGSRRDGMLTAQRAGPGAGEFAGDLSKRQDIVKRFDADGDGKLNETELAAMRQWVARQRGTNAPPVGPQVN
jgi:hypothetical protein